MLLPIATSYSMSTSLCRTLGVSWRGCLRPVFCVASAATQTRSCSTTRLLSFVSTNRSLRQAQSEEDVATTAKRETRTCVKQHVSDFNTNAAMPYSTFSTATANNRATTKTTTTTTTTTTTAGHIELIMGPMFSGKTTEMFRRINRYQIAGRRCLIIKYKKDTRYSNDMASTHDRRMIPARACLKLNECLDEIDDYDAIGIDDGHFFSDLETFSDECANRGKIVVVAALDGTYQRKAFAGVVELIPKAEQVVKLSSVCMRCSSDAAFTIRIGSETQVELIGGTDKYVAVCRGCYHAEQQKLR